MSLRQYEKSKLFLIDDFEIINKRYFKKLRENGKIEADLSFWYDTMSPISDNLKQPKINKYKSDYQKGLYKEKEVLMNCINQWDLQEYKYDEITICSSVTSASFITMLFLKSQKVKNVFFETPAYFASIEQAKSLDLEVYLFPTYIKNNFQIDDRDILSLQKYKKPKAIWLTQPRFSIGINQNIENIYKIFKVLNNDDFLVIDEATEQLFPTFLKEINLRQFKNVIKIRSFFKSTGLNGPRISFIVHNQKYRSTIENLLEVTQGAVDCFSLEFATKHLNNVDFFKSLLDHSNLYVNNLRKKIQIQTNGTRITAIPLENGYIGSIAIKLNGNKKYTLERKELLEYCSLNKVAVILGATMLFAKDKDFEFIRLNYFNTEYTILKGLELILKFHN